MTTPSSNPDSGLIPHARTLIKICGLTRTQDVDAAVAAGAHAVGFVLYPRSPRYVDIQRAAELARRLPPLVRPVLLFVNAAAREVEEAARRIPGAILQFHGDETAEQCTTLALRTGCPYWRAAHISERAGVASELLEFMRQYKAAQAILLDAKVEGYGGGGRPFDWTLLPSSMSAHLVLSGGLTPDNVQEGIGMLRGVGKSLAVDVSTGVEARDASGRALKGIKDAGRMQRFVAAVRAADQHYTRTDA